MNNDKPDQEIYSNRPETIAELSAENKWDEAFALNPTPEEIADAVQHLFEFGTEDHIYLTMQAIKRGVIKDLRAHPGPDCQMTIAQIWESTAYAQVLRLAGWKCDKDSDPEGKDFTARTQ